MSDRAHMRSGTSRRDLLKKAGIGAGVLVWSQPVIHAVTAAPAAAFTAFCDPSIPSTLISIDFIGNNGKTVVVMVNPSTDCGGECANPGTVNTSLTASRPGTFNQVDALTWTYVPDDCGAVRCIRLGIEVTLTCEDLVPISQCFNYDIELGSGCNSLDNGPCAFTPAICPPTSEPPCDPFPAC